MRVLPLILIACILLGANSLDAHDVAAAGPSARELSQVVTGNNAFGSDVYELLASRKGKVFFSPLGLYGALSLGSCGSREETESQMLTALHVKTRPERTHPALAEVVRQLTRDARGTGGRFWMHHGLWRQRGESLGKEFSDVASDCYGAEVNAVRFDAGRTAAGRAINAWARKYGGPHIRKLIRKGDLAGGTQLVITSAVCYAVPAPDAPEPEEPALREPTTRPDASAETSALVFMTKLAEEPEAPADAFSLRSRMHMQELLETLKLGSALNPEADFSGLTGWKNLYLADVIHEASIQVRGERTMACAVTALVFRTTGETVVASTAAGIR